MDWITLTKLKRIEHPKGDIFHALKKSEESFIDFGEAYFSTVNKNIVKGWKKHTKMILNIVVPVGKIKFVVYDELNNDFFEVILSKNNYQRLTVKPNYWLAFQGLGEFNMLLNLSSIEHDDKESENKSLDAFMYDWS